MSSLIDLKELVLPDENFWAAKAIRSCSSVYAPQGFDDIEQSFPKNQDVFTERGWYIFLKEVFQCAAIGILQQNIIGVTLLVAAQKLYQVFISFALGRQLHERIDFICVVAARVLGVVRLEDISIRWSSTEGLVPC